MVEKAELTGTLAGIGNICSPSGGGLTSRRGRRRAPHPGTLSLRYYDTIPEIISCSNGYQTKVFVGSTSARSIASKLSEELLRGKISRTLGNTREHEGRVRDGQHLQHHH